MRCSIMTLIIIKCWLEEYFTGQLLKKTFASFFHHALMEGNSWGSDPNLPYPQAGSGQVLKWKEQSSCEGQFIHTAHNWECSAANFWRLFTGHRDGKGHTACASIWPACVSDGNSISYGNHDVQWIQFQWGRYNRRPGAQHPHMKEGSQAHFSHFKILSICEGLLIFTCSKCMSTYLMGYFHLPEVIFAAKMLRGTPPQAMIGEPIMSHYLRCPYELQIKLQALLVFYKNFICSEFYSP